MPFQLENLPNVPSNVFQNSNPQKLHKISKTSIWAKTLNSHTKPTNSSSKTFSQIQKLLPLAKCSRNSPQILPLVDNAQIKEKCTKCNYKLLKYTISNTKCYKLEKGQVR